MKLSLTKYTEVNTHLTASHGEIESREDATESLFFIIFRTGGSQAKSKTNQKSTKNQSKISPKSIIFELHLELF